jgi:hypothetical protein
MAVRIGYYILKHAHFAKSSVALLTIVVKKPFLLMDIIYQFYNSNIKNIIISKDFISTPLLF